MPLFCAVCFGCFCWAGSGLCSGQFVLEFWVPVGLFRPFFTLRSRLCSGLLVSIFHPLAVQAGHWSVPHSSGWVLPGRATSVRLGLVRSCLVRYPSGLVWPGLSTALFWSVLFDSSQFSTVRSSPVHWQPCSIRGPAEPALHGSGRRQSSSVLASADRLGSPALLCLL